MTAELGGDPLGFVGRVMERVVDQLVPGEVLNEAGAISADELLASALGDGLARMIGSDEVPDHDAPSPVATSQEWLTHYHELLARNVALAAALGACDCWGQQPDCPICEGAGMPGWALPQGSLFAVYVQPAVEAAAPPRPTRPCETCSPDDNQPQET